MYYAGYVGRATLLDKDKRTVLFSFGYRNAANKQRRTDQSVPGLMLAKSGKRIELLDKTAEAYENGRYIKIDTGKLYKIIDRDNAPLNEFNPYGLQKVTLSLE